MATGKTKRKATGNRRPFTAPGRTERKHNVPLGRLIGPFAREIQHPLAALIASSELLVEETEPHHPCVGFARVIHQSSERINSAVADLLALAMPLEPKLRRVNLTTLLNEQVQLIRPEAEKSGVHILTKFKSGVTHVSTDSEALHLALGKLIQFSLDSMPFGGKLRVALDALNRKSVPLARIKMSDTGARIPDELMPRVLEPFFTTEGRRSGMVLALARKIVECLGGSLEVRNNPDAGLTVEIRLTLCE